MLPDKAIIFPKSPVTVSEKINTAHGSVKSAGDIPNLNNLSNPYCEDNIVHVKFVKIHQSSFASNRCVCEECTKRMTNEINNETKQKQHIEDA